MSQILSVVVSILFMFPAPEAQHCFSASHCCNESEVEHLGTHFQRTTRHTQSVASSSGCQAISDGLDRQRSISPWEYVEDHDPSRYPQSIWNAKCSCLSTCISLSCCVKQGNRNIYSKPVFHGNSVPVEHYTLVFYRTPCPGADGLYYLKADVYKMNVSCTCMVPENGMCHNSADRCHHAGFPNTRQGM
ncbi:interleukin-25 [Anolis carolinensis]|uniref:interleukin-25 n=1 Tax=Anolis carolinensis TaxID=28377 RepID=UPI000462E779|nr:PREDICTED: interleukin-25 [Anolis carolinensis]|eukprot:XP_008120552.1 PREDICTED: interleukin-25 [Anolis carolinensis]